MRLFVPLVLSVIVALPTLAAQPFRAVNRLYVYPLTADTFEVIEDRGAGARGIWCAASDYTKSAGRDGPRKRMYILEPRRPSKTVPGRNGVVFTLNPDERLRNTPSSYSVSVNRKGENLPVGHAYLFCDAIIDDLFDRF
ncbi:hypothetical protein KX928_08145 [Roseobacter sp. YSTF-M11]|uniref:Uncharacterized protein n=1 Tax=Roseobacter insulae TaxID=2859783 RepID=A0A9X1FUF4_9RHOB|nr:hypothetical protein [Roseobacter insulae]MBW4707756.1 hypothetical protein [Roseobacter insulae]